MSGLDVLPGKVAHGVYELVTVLLIMRGPLCNGHIVAEHRLELLHQVVVHFLLQTIFGASSGDRLLLLGLVIEASEVRDVFRHRVI